MRFATFPLVVSTIVLCAGAHAGWVKEGASPDDLKRDQSQCERKASSSAEFARVSPGSPGTRAGGTLRGANTMARENQYFQLCMREKAYEWIDQK